MALIEKVTKKIEIDENNGSHIHIRETTHIIDDVTGKIVHQNIRHHRKVIEVGDDKGAFENGITKYSDIAWTKEVRDKYKAEKEKMEAELKKLNKDPIVV